MPNTFTLIASSTVGSGGSADITFSSIPSTYTDLCLKLSLRTNNNPDSNGYGLAALSVNGTSTSFTNRRLISDTGGGLTSSFTSTSTNLYVLTTGSSLTSSTFSNGELYFPNYKETGVNKSISIDTVNENNAAQNWLTLYAGIWNNTAAITSIGFSAVSGLFVQYTTAYLYGVKNA
jgi:hypothetical protein